MRDPTPEQLALLGPLERVNFRIADWVSRNAKGLSTAWNSTFMVGLLSLGTSRRYQVRGLENVAGMGPDARVILIANHRSFFDFFMITSMIFRHTTLPRRTFFPVRAAFFYDSVVGLFVNAIMSGLTMFPPILRDRRRMRFNLYSLRRLADELAQPGTVVGLHPEGTRGKGPDPYALLPPQLGAARIALDADGAAVVPVFILGLTNGFWTEIFYNLFEPDAHPVDVLFGPPLELDDLRARGLGLSNQREAAALMMDALCRLGDDHRRLSAERAASRTPQPAR